MSLSYNYPPQYAYPSAPPVYRAFLSPPRLHWAWVLVLSIVTAGVFWMVWMVVQAYWVKKATGNSKAFAWTLAYLFFVVGLMVVAVAGSVFYTLTEQHSLIADFMDTLQNLRRAVGFLLYIMSAFMLKSALESSPIGIPLHGLGALFLGPVYFQYFLQNYSVEGKLGEQLSGFDESVEDVDPMAVADVPEAPPQT